MHRPPPHLLPLPSAWVLHLVILLAAVGCSSGSGTDPPADIDHLQLFGFVGVACGEDYSAEVASFTNVATTCAPDPSVAALVGDQLDRLAARSLGALLNAEGVFFEPDPDGAVAPEGSPRLVLRADYQARWSALVDGARLRDRRSALAAVFVADEPTWRGIAPEELAAAYQAVAATLPDVPLLLIEAYPVLDQLVVPEVVDWVAFDRYGVGDPASDAAYLADLATLKARRARPDQRVVLVMETQWLPAYADLGVPPEGMATVAESYYRLAQQDPSVLGIVGYLWPSGLDAPSQLGARDLPASVQAVYREMGRAIMAAPAGPRP